MAKPFQFAAAKPVQTQQPRPTAEHSETCPRTQTKNDARSKTWKSETACSDLHTWARLPESIFFFFRGKENNVQRTPDLGHCGISRVHFGAELQASVKHANFCHPCKRDCLPILASTKQMQFRMPRRRSRKIMKRNSSIVIPFRIFLLKK